MSGARGRLLLILPTHTYQADEFMAAASRLDVDVTVGTETPSSLESMQPGRLATIDLTDPKRAVRQAEEFSQHYPLTAVFGVNDAATIVAAAIAERLSLPSVSLEAARRAGNKLEQRRALREAGVQVPDFTWHSEGGPLPALDPPVVLKPTCLSASRGVIRVDRVESMSTAVTRVTEIVRKNAQAGAAREADYLAESFVDGPEFALEGLVVDGTLHTLAIFDKPDPLDGPYFEETIYVTPSRFPQDVQDSLRQCAADAVSALGIRSGPVHIELRHNACGAWLIELAARPIGGKCARVLEFEGVRSLEDLLLSHATGADYSVPPLREGATGVYMIPAHSSGIIESIGGLESAAAVENVEDVVITAHRNQRVETLPEGAVYLGFVFARAPDPEAVERALRAAFSEVRISIRPV